MTVNEMRGILQAYYGPKATGWKAKVDKMKDSQVLAIFRRWQQEGKV
jgi:hypothetical protein